MTKGIRFSISENEHQRLVKELPKANASFFGISNAQRQKAFNNAEKGLAIAMNDSSWKRKERLTERVLKQYNEAGDE